MDRFDFISRFSLGQYLPTASVIHRVDPRAKLIGYAALLLALTFTKHIGALATAVVLILILLAMSRVSLKTALRGLSAPLPFIILLAILQLFLAPHTIDSLLLFSYGILKIFDVAIVSALTLLVRFTGLILLLSAASATLSTLEIIYGLNLLLRPLGKLGIPVNSIVMVIQIMLRFIPFLLINAEKIAKSQASRGAGWDSAQGGIFRRVQQFIPVIIPLFSTSIQQAENLAYAMVARGFESSAARTGLREYRFKFRDLVFLMLCLSAAALFLIWF